MNRLSLNQQITFIYVQELETSRKFYEELVGFRLILDQGGCRVVETAGGGYLGYCTRVNKPQSRDGIILTLVTSQVDEWYLYFVDKGINIPEPPKVNPNYNIYHFFLKDPDGYILEFQQFLDPNWNKREGQNGD